MKKSFLCFAKKYYTMRYNFIAKTMNFSIKGFKPTLRYSMVTESLKKLKNIELKPTRLQGNILKIKRSLKNIKFFFSYTRQDKRLILISFFHIIYRNLSSIYILCSFSFFEERVSQLYISSRL